MPYPITYSDTSNPNNPIMVADNDVDVSTSLTFPGKNTTNYASTIATNFLQLLENFASPTAPTNPTAGQLWYDTTVSQPQLKVYDGAKWTEAGNVKKGTSQPASVNSIPGDLWVDTVNQQLYLYTGSLWVLVGPQFSEGTESGIKAETVIDRNTNTGKIVLIFYINGVPIIIVSKDTFVPKVAINGFEIIKQGVNISTADFDLDGTMLNKFWGTSEKADALIVGNSVVPAANFLRSDAVSTTNFVINIRNGGGLVLGSSLETSLTTSSTGVILSHKTPGSPIILRTTTTGGVPKDVITVTGNERVGINKSPAEALDVSGNILTDGFIRTTSTTESTSTTTGAVRVAGGVGIEKNLNVGGSAELGGTLTVRHSGSSGVAIAPKTNEQFDIGSSGNRFNTTYSRFFRGERFYGDFEGTLTGDVSGTASRLFSSSNFRITGDMISNTVGFNGTADVNLVAVISDDIITSKTALTDARDNDFFLVYRASETPPLRKINKATLFSTSGTVPPGSIFPFAGDAVPAGYLLCDGSEQSRSAYPELFAVIGYKYKPSSLLTGYQTFALPDLRGRFPLGRDDMDNTSTVSIQITATAASRAAITALGAITATFIVKDGTPPTPGAPGTTNGPFQTGKTLEGTGLDTTNGPVVITTVTPNTPSAGFSTLTVSMPAQTVTYTAASGLTLTSLGTIDSGGGAAGRVPSATSIGNVSGSRQTTLSVNQLPEHLHDMKDSVGNQFFALRNASGAPAEPEVSSQFIHFANSSAGQLLRNSGGISTTGSLGQPVDLMNPYQTINYIIFTGRII